MKKRVFRYIKHLVITLLFLASIAIIIGYTEGAAIHYGDNPLALNWNNDGPYIFFKDDSTVSINYIKGNREKGYYVNREESSVDSSIKTVCYFPLDSTKFEFEVDKKFTTPNGTYNDNNKILAISDIESSYKTFRDFLINSKVINKKLHWTFGNGHLVLVGDFMDRGNSTTQVLWFIYKLEQEAKKQGGNVHFILGNHELYNFQGNYKSASRKYYHIASILGKQQFELYDKNSFLGRWMSSKNTMELINGNLFTHGGVHPDLADSELNINDINQIIRANYYQPYYPRKEKDSGEILISHKTSPCWYRGLFKDDLTQEQIDRSLDKFKAKSVIVGHTIQKKVNRSYNGKVIGIDVKHPNDYHKNFPEGRSEALLIIDGKYYRVLDNGEKEEI